MKSSIKRQLKTFFDQFSVFSERAARHWPIPEKANNPYEDDEIKYQFELILTDSHWSDDSNIQIIKSFFELYNKSPEAVFSRGARMISEDEIRGQIRNLNTLAQCLHNPTEKPFTFLIIGFVPKEIEVRVGCVGHYLPGSRSVFIESVLINDDLLGTSRRPLSDNAVSDDFKKALEFEISQQKVLGWLLTHIPRHQDGQKGALYSLVNFLEENVAWIPIISSEKKSPNFANKVVLGVFHEAVNPIMIKKVNHDAASATLPSPKFRERLAVKTLSAFHGIDARFLRFAYRHPSFDSKLNDDRNYFLLTFPQALKVPDWLAVESGIIMAFIVNHSYALQNSYIHFQTDLNRCWNFVPAKRTPLRGFKDGSNNDSISLNSKSLFENRFTEHSTVLYLHKVPSLEEPRFLYKRASIGFEIIIDEDYFEPTGIDPYHDMAPRKPVRTRLGRIVDMVKKELRLTSSVKPVALYCPVAHSGESDLFAYKYQSEPPYFTRYYGLRSNKVTVHFPSHFEFTSEGRVETFYRLPHNDAIEPVLFNMETGQDNALPSFMYQVEMTACVSYTYFLKSAIRVWHLVLKPNEDQNGITELETIKLMRFFSGSQEHESEEDRRKVMREVKFVVGDNKFNKETQIEDKKSDSGGLFFFDRDWCFPKRHFIENISEEALEKGIRKILWWVKTIPWFLRGIERSCIEIVEILRRIFYSFFNIERLEVDMPWLTKPDNLVELLTQLTGVKYSQNQDGKIERLMDKADLAVSLRNVRSGVVEIDTGDITPKPTNPGEVDEEKLDFNNFLRFEKNPDAPTLTLDEKNTIREKVRALYKSLHDDDVEMPKKPEDFSAEEYADYVFKSYCGICLGIFDYDRMGFQEIDDTLVPLPDSKTETSFMVIHRGVLAMLGYEDDVMDTFWNTLGINAYLLIPSAVLANNDYISRDAEGRLNQLLDELRNGKSKRSIPELIGQRNTIDDLLNDDILGNVFQYKTETELFTQGMERRGISERIKDSVLKLEQLDKLISAKQEELSSKYQRRIQNLVTIVGAFSFYQIIRDFFKDELSKKVPGNENVVVCLEDVPVWFKVPLQALDRISPIRIFSLKESYDPLDLAHLSIQIVFAVLIIYLLITNLFDPNRSRKYFWQRKRSAKRILPQMRPKTGKAAQ